MLLECLLLNCLYSCFVKSINTIAIYKSKICKNKVLISKLWKSGNVVEISHFDMASRVSLLRRANRVEVM